MPAPIAIYDDRPTVLMGDAADHRGTFRVVSPVNGAKHFPVSEWCQAQDSLGWQVDAPAGDYAVTALIQGYGAEVRLTCEGQTLCVAIDGDWDRIDLGNLHLSAGCHTLTLEAPKPGHDLELYSLEIIRPATAERVRSEVASLRADTTWMREGLYGLQLHWTSQSQPRHGAQLPYDEAVAAFDVERFAAMVHELGAKHVTFTTSHAEFYFPAPIAAIDAIMPGRTSERDLVADLIAALGARDIRLMLYYHNGHGHAPEPDGWWERTGFPTDTERFVDNWCAQISEAGERYGSGLAGWWFDDGCVYYPLNPSFFRMGQAAKAGHPGRVVCYNPWIWPRLTDYQDYFCGETYRYLTETRHLPADRSGVFSGGPQAGLQAHTNFVLEGYWVHDQPESPIPTPNVPLEQFLEDSVAAIGRGIVPSFNLEIYQDGGISPQSRDYLLALKERVRG